MKVSVSGDYFEKFFWDDPLLIHVGQFAKCHSLSMNRGFDDQANEKANKQRSMTDDAILTTTYRILGLIAHLGEQMCALVCLKTSVSSLVY